MPGLAWLSSSPRQFAAGKLMPGCSKSAAIVVRVEPRSNQSSNPDPRVVRSETEFHGILNLEGIRSVAGSAESQQRIGRQIQVDSSIDRIQVRDVRAIEQVKEVAAELDD